MLAQALIASNDARLPTRRSRILRDALVHEKELVSGYRQLAMAFGRKGDLAQADLASAQASFARRLQDRARAGHARQDPPADRLARLGQGRRHRDLPAAEAELTRAACAARPRPNPLTEP